MGKDPIEPQDVMSLFKLPKKLSVQVLQYAHKILTRAIEFDGQIEKLSQEWSLERISILERQIIRFGLYELSKGELDNGVVIAEMTRLCKKFSTDASREFVHALLDASIKSLQKVGM